MGGRIIDRTGMKFGHLTVVALAPERDPRGHAVWLCDCSACGSKGKRVRAGHLAVTNSCGCLKGNRVPKKGCLLRQNG